MEYVIYCDESDRDGKHFANFYGGALVRSSDWNKVIDHLNATKTRLNLHRELKWSKVTENYLGKYQQFMSEYFALISDDKLKIRIMFTHQLRRPRGLTKEQSENSYFLLYYQFIKHAFGLHFGNPGSEPIPVRVHFDRLPDTKEKADRFKGFICALEKSKEFRDAKLRFSKENVVEVDSSHHPILQGVDIILGAMAFRLNEKHKALLEGTRRRGKKTVAKEKLYKHILTEIRKLRPNFNIGVTTGSQTLQDRWLHSYRHWCFESKNTELDPSRIKKRPK